ncbi:MAG: hypothetical protein HY924_12310 [Elusimicrobia bacterium]|nr:hypothetical protein [Elusimicrobiota bacterium]
MGKKEPAKFTLSIDIQCGVCGSLNHQGEGFPKFCPCCGAALERYCLRCQRKAEMFFEEWWPQEDHCIRTYSPAKRCSRCNAVLEMEGESRGHEDREERHN